MKTIKDFKRLSFLICPQCNLKVYPFSEPKKCECGKLEIDMERSTSTEIYLKGHEQGFQSAFEKPKTFKDELLDILKDKNKVC